MLLDKLVKIMRMFLSNRIRIQKNYIMLHEVEFPSVLYLFLECCESNVVLKKAKNLILMKLI